MTLYVSFETTNDECCYPTRKSERERVSAVIWSEYKRVELYRCIHIRRHAPVCHVTDLDPPDVRRRLGERTSGADHAPIPYARTPAGESFVFATVAALLLLLVGWSVVEAVAGPDALAPSLPSVVVAAGSAFLGAVVAWAVRRSRGRRDARDR